MLHLRSLTAAALALGLTAAAPTFAKADTHPAARGGHPARVEQVTRADRGRVQQEVRADRRVRTERDVRVTREVQRDVRVDREVRRDYGRDYGRGYSRDDRRGWYGGVSVGIGPVYVTPGYVAPVCVEPVYAVAAYAGPDVDLTVAPADVPACVLDAACAQGGPVEVVQYVRREGRVFYRCTVTTRRGALTVRLGTDGSVLGFD